MEQLICGECITKEWDVTSVLSSGAGAASLGRSRDQSRGVALHGMGSALQDTWIRRISIRFSSPILA